MPSVGHKRGVRRVGHSRTRRRVKLNEDTKMNDAMMKELAKGDKELVMTVHEKPSGDREGMEMRMYMQKRRRA